MIAAKAPGRAPQGPTLTLRQPWLILDLGTGHQVLSWALNRPGLVTARRIVWREVRSADLPEGRDARRWLRAELDRAGLGNAICLLTARDIATAVRTDVRVEGAAVTAVATAGLGNAERIGSRRDVRAIVGTINIAVVSATPLGPGGLAEILSLATEARTAAVLAAGIPLPAGTATGTGTDCIAVAAPPAADPTHAGKHTAIGEAAGRAVLEAVAAATAAWVAKHGRSVDTWTI